jgi:hypothetical protein
MIITWKVEGILKLHSKVFEKFDLKTYPLMQNYIISKEKIMHGKSKNIRVLQN